VAAPSANRSAQLSPTRAEHVLRGLGGRIDLVLDAGPTSGGIESTVLDLTASPPRLLRPGLTPPAALEAVIGPVARPAPALAPGLYAALHALDDKGLERIVVALPPDTAPWLAVRDRLRRASA